MAEANKTTNEATAEKSVAAANLPTVASESPDAMLSLPAVSAYPQLNTTPSISVQMKRLPSFGKGDGFKIGVAPKTLPAVRRFVGSTVAQLIRLPSHSGTGGRMKVGPGTQNDGADMQTPTAVNDLVTNGTLEDVDQAIDDLTTSILNRKQELQPAASASASAAASQSTSQERHLARIRLEEGWLAQLTQRSRNLRIQQSPHPLAFSGPQQNNNSTTAAAASSGRNSTQQVPLSSANSRFNDTLPGMQGTPAPTNSVGNNFAAALIPGFTARNANATLSDRLREQQQRAGNQSGTTSSSATAGTGNAIPSNQQLPPANQQPGNNGGSAGSSAPASIGNATSGNQQLPSANQRNNQQPENKRGRRTPRGKK